MQVWEKKEVVWLDDLVITEIVVVDQCKVLTHNATYSYVNLLHLYVLVFLVHQTWRCGIVVVALALDVAIVVVGARLHLMGESDE